MTDDFYKQAFESALGELSDLQRRRKVLRKKLEETDTRMEKVRQAALGLLSLAGADFQEIKGRYPELFDNTLDPRIGITEAVRQVLTPSEEMLTINQIRDGVFQISPAIAAQKNPIASLYTVLRRFMDNDEVISGIFEDGKTVYGWVDCNEGEERIKRWFAIDGEEAWEALKAKKAKKE